MEGQKELVEKQIDLLNELIKGEATIYLLLEAIAKKVGMTNAEIPKTYTSMSVEPP